MNIKDIKTKEQAMEYVASISTQELTKWLAEHSEESIRKQTREALDKTASQTALRLLGFNRSYNGHIEIDHCNGRSGESAIGDYFRKTKEKSIKEFLDTLDLTKVGISSSDKDRLKGVYKKELIKELEDRLKMLAKAQTVSLLAPLKPEDSIDAQVAKTLAMLNALDTPIESLIPNQGK